MFVLAATVQPLDVDGEATRAQVLKQDKASAVIVAAPQIGNCVMRLSRKQIDGDGYELAHCGGVAHGTPPPPLRGAGSPPPSSDPPLPSSPAGARGLRITRRRRA